MKNIPITLILPLALAACSISPVDPTSAELKLADYGEKPTQNECQQYVVETLTPLLKDPVSALYEFTRCEKRGLSSIPLYGIPQQYGYHIIAFVNAKNSFGGYVGREKYGFLFNNGVLLRKRRESGGYWVPFK